MAGRDGSDTSRYCFKFIAPIKLGPSRSTRALNDHPNVKLPEDLIPAGFCANPIDERTSGIMTNHERIR
jgi:hypothetical protein